MREKALLIIVLTLVSKVFGFFRDIILSYVYGAGDISDAYLIAYTIPGVIFSFIGTGIATSFIPLYSDIEKSRNIEEANSFTSNMISILLVICTIIIALGYNFTQPLVKIFAIGFDSNTLDMAVKFTRVTLLGIYISVIIHILTSYLNIKNNFHIPALIGIPNNIIIMLAILFSDKTNIMLLPIGVIAALISQLLFVLVYVKKENFRFSFHINIKDKNINKLVYLSLPVILGVSVNQVNVLVDKTMASTMAVGGISALNYANRLNLFIYGLFVVSFVTAMYPTISKMVAENNINSLKKTLKETIVSVSLLVLPATVGAMILTEPLVTLLFGRGAFDLQAIRLTSSALFYYSIGMIGYGIREVLSRIFYAMQDTKTPMINATIGMIINIILNIILSHYYGIAGLAFATSIAALFTSGLMLITLRKKIGPFGMQNISISLIKILSASLMMGLIAKLSFNYMALVISQNLSLVFAIGIGAITYFIIIYFMKIEDVDAMVNLIKRKVKTRTS